jgi:hypothetical protein
MHSFVKNQLLLFMCGVILAGVLAATRFFCSRSFRSFHTMPSTVKELGVEKKHDRGSPTRVLVAGGSYGGLAAALNLLDLCERKPARFTPDGKVSENVVPIHIKIVDERDGYCKVPDSN